jgi:hypothetical protein
MNGSRSPTRPTGPRADHRGTVTPAERGSATAELVVATPLLLLLLLLIVQFALWQQAAHVAAAVAQEGLASTRTTGGSVSVGQTQAQQVLDQLGRTVLVDPRITASRDARAARVEVTGYAEPVVPFLHLPVHAVAAGPVEVFTSGR